MAVSKTSTAGTSHGCYSTASAVPATCAASWRGWRKPSTQSHVHPRLGGLTPAQHRRGLRLQKLPARFVAPTEALPIAAGRVTFIRRVSTAGTVSMLSQTFRVGKRHRGLYVRLVLNTQQGRLSAYLDGRLLKRWPYKLLNK